MISMEKQIAFLYYITLGFVIYHVIRIGSKFTLGVFMTCVTFCMANGEKLEDNKNEKVPK